MIPPVTHAPEHQRIVHGACAHQVLLGPEGSTRDVVAMQFQRHRFSRSQRLHLLVRHPSAAATLLHFQTSPPRPVRSQHPKVPSPSPRPLKLATKPSVTVKLQHQQRWLVVRVPSCSTVARRSICASQQKRIHTLGPTPDTLGLPHAKYAPSLLCTHLDGILTLHIPSMSSTCTCGEVGRRRGAHCLSP